MGERRIGAITAIKARAPVLGGNFGVWGGLFSTFDCAVKGIRKKEDPYNAIIAGFFTGGSLAIRGGYKAARNGAIGCAVLLAVIEGVGIGFQKLMAGSTKLEVCFSFLPSLADVGEAGKSVLTRAGVTGTTAAAEHRQGSGVRDENNVGTTTTNTAEDPRFTTLLFYRFARSGGLCISPRDMNDDIWKGPCN